MRLLLSAAVLLCLCVDGAHGHVAGLGRSPPRPVAPWRSHRIVSQLVRIDKPSNDDDGDDDDDGSILQVSQIADADGQSLPETGRSVASLQFMITQAMRRELYALGYTEAEVDAMEPPRAAKIIAKKMPSSKRAQRKPKTKRARFELQFTCNICDGPNSHSISWHAYNKGTVLVTCPGCQSAHLIADNLNWIEDDFRTLEQYMADRGTPVSRLVDDGIAAAAAAAASVPADGEADDAQEEDEEDGASSNEQDIEVIDSRRPWRGTKPGVQPIDGITDEQAARIREAVRKRKRRKQADADEADE